LILGAADRITVSTALFPLALRQRSPKRERADALPPRRRRPVPRSKPQPTAIALEAAADAGRIDEVLELSAGLLAQNPLDAEVCFIRGLAQLGAGDPRAAVASLRQAVYARPGFGLAAFKLGRALELCGERGSATQAYSQALRALERGDDQEQVDSMTASDIAAACRMRIRALS
jgi:tetratricopeptide (TPR) repeat protein